MARVVVAAAATAKEGTRGGHIVRLGLLNWGKNIRDSKIFLKINRAAAKLPPPEY